MSQQKESESDQLSPADIIQIVGRTGIAVRLFKLELKFVKVKTKAVFLLEM